MFEILSFQTISTNSDQSNTHTVQDNRPTLPAGVPHLRPPAQHNVPPGPSSASNLLHQPSNGPVHQSIDSLISSQRIAAESIANKVPSRRVPLMGRETRPLLRPGVPPPSRPGVLAASRPGVPPPSRIGVPQPPRIGTTPIRHGAPLQPRMGVRPQSGMGAPPLRHGLPSPRSVRPSMPPPAAPRVRNPAQGPRPIKGNIQQMIALATKITGNRPPTPKTQ